LGLFSTEGGARKRMANEEADDLRVEEIAAQIEENRQQDLLEGWNVPAQELWCLDPTCAHWSATASAPHPPKEPEA
jgi:hypothetical protein